MVGSVGFEPIILVGSVVASFKDIGRGGHVGPLLLEALYWRFQLRTTHKKLKRFLRTRPEESLRKTFKK
jgi:hypothetical protein